MHDITYNCRVYVPVYLIFHCVNKSNPFNDIQIPRRCDKWKYPVFLQVTMAEYDDELRYDGQQLAIGRLQ
jgi:hypothetical protein